jgi:hypothetical protein
LLLSEKGIVLIGFRTGVILKLQLTKDFKVVPISINIITSKILKETKNQILKENII